MEGKLIENYILDSQTEYMRDLIPHIHYEARKMDLYVRDVFTTSTAAEKEA